MQKSIGILHQRNGSRSDCAVKQGEASQSFGGRQSGNQSSLNRVDEKVRLTRIHRNSAISCTANRGYECIHPAGR
jgi:hypothetical protein